MATLFDVRRIGEVLNTEGWVGEMINELTQRIQAHGERRPIHNSRIRYSDHDCLGGGIRLRSYSTLRYNSIKSG